MNGTRSRVARPERSSVLTDSRPPSFRSYTRRMNCTRATVARTRRARSEPILRARSYRSYAPRMNPSLERGGSGGDRDAPRRGLDGAGEGRDRAVDAGAIDLLASNGTDPRRAEAADLHA